MKIAIGLVIVIGLLIAICLYWDIKSNDKESNLV